MGLEGSHAACVLPRSVTSCRLGDLLAIEPFADRLVHAQVPGDLPNLVSQLAEQTGRVVLSHDPLPPGTRSVLTTGCLADTHLCGRRHEASLRLGHALHRALAGPSRGTKWTSPAPRHSRRP
jgi:hypothetical protein